jgi:hypothetical protein
MPLSGRKPVSYVYAIILAGREWLEHYDDGRRL